MSGNKSEEDAESRELENINIHNARLRVLLQTLREKEAVITLDLDKYGKSKTTSYSSGDTTDNSLKELILSLWTDATDGAYYEYFKDYKVNKKKTIKNKHHPSHEKFILGIVCTFSKTPSIKQREEKEQLFFSGDHRDATNLHAAFPTFRNDIKKEIERFKKLLTNEDGFPYQSLRNHTSHRCHRYKQLEKSIFQFLKDSNQSTLNNIRSNLTEVMSTYGEYLDDLEEKGVSHGQPKNGAKVENSLSFKELSLHGGRININENDEKELEKIGFQDSFSNKKDWFDQFRFKKIAYWKSALEDLPISDWPEYYLEHILLAYFELNSVCSKIVQIRNQLYEEVGYYIKYSMDGKEIVTIEPELSHQDLATTLSNYEYVSNAFVDTLRSDANLLVDPLRRLPEAFEQITRPDQLFKSRVKKLIWDYLLYRMCNSCELNKEHVKNFEYSPHTV